MSTHIFNKVLSLIKYTLKFEMHCCCYTTTHLYLKSSLVLGRVDHDFSWHHKDGMWPSLGQSQHHNCKNSLLDSEMLRPPSPCKSTSPRKALPRLSKAALFLLRLLCFQNWVPWSWWPRFHYKGRARLGMKPTQKKLKPRDEEGAMG